MAGCRIGKVRWKNPKLAGVIQSQRSPEANTLVRHAAACADYEEDSGGAKISAHVVVALFDDGAFLVGTRYYAHSHVPAHAVPAMVAEAVREHIITYPAAREVMDECLDANDR